MTPLDTGAPADAYEGHAKRGCSVDQRARGWVQGFSRKIKLSCEEIALDLSVKHVDRILGLFQPKSVEIKPKSSFSFFRESDVEKMTDIKCRDFYHLMEELKLRIEDELQSQLFLWVPISRSGIYSNPLTSLEEVVAKFPSARRELEESGKCYAVGRFTASVFHQMRALEPFLAVISRELGVVKHSPTWAAYLSAFSPAIEAKYPGKIPANTEIRNFYSGATGYLSGMKNAFRNPTMHDVDIVYTEEEARDVRNAVGAFMRHLATKLKE